MHSKKIGLVTSVVLSFMLAFCLTSVGYAFTYYNKPISKSNTISFLLHNGFSSTSRQHFSDAANTWNTAVGGLPLLHMATATHSNTNYPNNDGVSLVYRVNAGTAYLAEVQPYNSGSYVVSADININMYYAWANSAQAGYYDTGSAFTHELGHVMGLGHAVISGAVMYPTLATNVVIRNLHLDDSVGVKTLY